MTIVGRLFQLSIVRFHLALAALGGYNVGCNESWSSPVQPQIQLNETLSEDGSVWDVRVTEEEMSWIGSLVNIGALLGSLFGGLLMDKYGRKTTLMAVSVPYIIGWLFITFAVHPSNLTRFTNQLCCRTCISLFL